MTDINGNILILQARTVLGSQKALYVTSEYLGIESIVHLPTVSEAGAWFGMDIINWKEPVLIVEGCFDAMKAYTFGFKNCIAPFGSSITETQISSLIGGSYLIGLDSDDSGKQGAIKLIKKLIKKNTVSYINWSSVKAKDVGEISDTNSFWYAIDKRKVIY
jgi:5S rRNA maturation endonuclease (ribonuclease M5)